MAISFVHLNKDWNAEPNAPEEEILQSTSEELVLEFTANSWAYPGFDEDQRVTLVFSFPKKYRLGPTNDEGWYSGKCRFKKLARKWGEFYQVIGNSNEVADAKDWVTISKAGGSDLFLFYLRDSTFECHAHSYEFRK